MSGYRIIYDYDILIGYEGEKTVNREFKLKAVIFSSTAEKPCMCGSNKQKLESSVGSNWAILEK